MTDDISTIEQLIEQAPERRRKAKERARRGYVQQKQIGAVLDTLADAIGAVRSPSRGRPQKWVRAIGEPAADRRTALDVVDFPLLDTPIHNTTSDRWLALAVLAPLLSPWRNDTQPSARSILGRIGRILFEHTAMPAKLADQAGHRLLLLAQSAGIVELRKVARPGRDRPITRVFPSIRTAAEFEHVQRTLAADKTLRYTLDHPPQVPRFVPITPNGSPNPPPQPVDNRVRDALNLAQGTPWRVNARMLNVLTAAPIVKRYLADRVNHTAKRHDVLAALAHASEWRDRPQFFYRYRCDWRGRWYQDGGALQWTSGSDFARALLEFAQGEKLNDTGRKWLSDYLAGCYGVKEVARRAEWVKKHHDKIMRAAADPLQLKWWQLASEPYRFLAACDAYARAERGEEVHLPVAADCSCSGLQHYALLCRDLELAKRVGLCDTQGDFYDLVAKRVSEKWHQRVTRSEVKQGCMISFYGAQSETIAEGIAARELEQYADDPAALKACQREHVKAAKRRRALLKKLKLEHEKLKKLRKQEPRPRARIKRQRAKIAALEARLPPTHEQLAALIKSEAWQVAGEPARAVYHWLRGRKHRLKKNAVRGVALACTSSRRTIEWTSPSGFRVLHNKRITRTNKLRIPLYRKRRKGHVPGKVVSVVLVERVPTNKTSGRRQRLGIAPNYIHSLDAATLVELVRRGATLGIDRFGLAHDSFACPPNQGDELRAALQGATRAIYGASDPLGSLHAQTVARGVTLDEPPKGRAEKLPAGFTLRYMIV